MTQSDSHKVNTAIDSLRTVIVDDESLARRSLQRCLTAFPDVAVVGESDRGQEAVPLIRSLRPDLVFLDVEMPGMDGFEVVERLRPDVSPMVVFVTAYDRHAVRAFQAHALDFILKPLNECRVGEVMERVLEQARFRRYDQFEFRLSAVLSELEARRKGLAKQEEPQDAPVERVAIKDKGRIRLLDVLSIDWIEACGNYVTLHATSGKHLVRETMNAIERRLDAKQFLRIHRSTIVNVQSIVEFRPAFNGSFLVLMKDQTRLHSSRGYHHRMEYFLTSLQ